MFRGMIEDFDDAPGSFLVFLELGAAPASLRETNNFLCGKNWEEGLYFISPSSLDPTFKGKHTLEILCWMDFDRVAGWKESSPGKTSPGISAIQSRNFRENGIEYSAGLPGDRREHIEHGSGHASDQSSLHPKPRRSGHGCEPGGASAGHTAYAPQEQATKSVFRGPVRGHSRYHRHRRHFLHAVRRDPGAGRAVGTIETDAGEGFMRIHLIYPKWPKMPHQTRFDLPPHGPVCFAAGVPDNIEIVFTDENVQELDTNVEADLVCVSIMLTCQAPRGWEIADEYRRKGHTVVFGGIAATLHAEETATHADSVFLGEAEGFFPQVIEDFQKRRLRPVYRPDRYPDLTALPPADRSILNYDLYTYKGVRMVDLIHASRGCRFNCYPCCVPVLGGRTFRPRPPERVVEEIAGIDNDRLFFVDNSLAQDRKWVLDLFRAIAPLKKQWISHPLFNTDQVVKAAADAGCWYVYQAVYDMSEKTRTRIRRLKDHGIGVEGTVLLGLDDQKEEDIFRMVDFLLEVDLDLAEFTVLTPFPHSQAYADLDRQGRILHKDWRRYTASEAVFQPRHMSPDRLDDLHRYAWETFYSDESQQQRMFKLFLKLLKKRSVGSTGEQ